MCFVCFHTGFVEGERMCFNKALIDIACKDTSHKIFSPDFGVSLCVCIYAK